MTQRSAYATIAPDAIQGLSASSRYLDSCSIEARLRALVELRVSQINGCAYCVDMHSRQARHAGESQQRLDLLSVWHETTLYDERERAALAWAESVTRIAETRAPDDVYEQALRHFSEKELIDLTLIVAVMNAWNRIAISFRQAPAARPSG
jgi:AhpD family alkylhydroperoxidase